MRRRRFQFVAGTSSKFWEVEVEHGELVVCFGRIGTSGQTQRKKLGPDALAQVEKLVAEKVRKGYVEVAPLGIVADEVATASDRTREEREASSATTPATATTSVGAAVATPRQALSLPEAIRVINRDRAMTDARALSAADVYRLEEIELRSGRRYCEVHADMPFDSSSGGPPCAVTVFTLRS